MRVSASQRNLFTLEVACFSSTQLSCICVKLRCRILNSCLLKSVITVLLHSGFHTWRWNLERIMYQFHNTITLFCDVHSDRATSCKCIIVLCCHLGGSSYELWQPNSKTLNKKTTIFSLCLHAGCASDDYCSAGFVRLLYESLQNRWLFDFGGLINIIFVSRLIRFFRLISNSSRRQVEFNRTCFFFKEKRSACSNFATTPLQIRL